MWLVDTLKVDEAEVIAGYFVQLVEGIIYYMIQKSYQKNIRIHGIILGLIFVNFKTIHIFPFYHLKYVQLF
jgi:hypothetical protein